MKHSESNVKAARMTSVASTTEDFDTKQARIKAYITRAETEAPASEVPPPERARTTRPTDSSTAKAPERPAPKPASKSAPSIIQKIKADVRKEHQIRDPGRSNGMQPRMSRPDARFPSGMASLSQSTSSKSKSSHHTPAPQPSMFGPVQSQRLGEETEAWASRDEALRPRATPAPSRRTTDTYAQDAKPQLEQAVTSIETGFPARSGPFSLNSAAGVAAVRSATAAPASNGYPKSKQDFIPLREQRAAGDTSWFNRAGVTKFHSAPGLHNRNRFGTRCEIVPEDLRIVKWREEGESWASIVALSRTDTGIQRSEGLLKDIYKRVASLIQPKEITMDLLNDVLRGSPTALQDLRDRIDATCDRDAAPLYIKALERGPKKFSLSKAALAEVITVGDLMICYWKEMKHSFAEIIPMFEEKTGVLRSDNWLRVRWHKVSAAIKNDEISAELLRSAMDGDEDALTEINRIVAAARSMREQTTTTEAGSSSTQKSGPRVKIHPGHDNSKFTAGMRSPPESPSSQTVIGSPRSNAALSSTQSRHPTEGGKTINADAMRYYLDICLEHYDGETAVERRARAQSPITVKDQCHNAFQVERRYSIPAEPDEANGEPQFEGWVAAGEPFATRKAAELRVWEVIPTLSTTKDESFVSMEEAQLTRRRDENRMLIVTSETEAGMVQMRVRRHLRTCHDRITPASKEGWLPVQLFFVYSCITVTVPGDEDSELFGGEQKTVKKEMLDNAAFSDLSLANDRAMDEWTEKFVPPMPNLTNRSIVKNEAKEQLKCILVEKGEDWQFEMEAEVEDQGGKKVIKVWVEAGELKGPRNF